jgi:hypothetical protein
LPQNVFLCFKRFSALMLIITGSNINQLIPAVLTHCVHCEEGAEILNIY